MNATLLNGASYSFDRNGNNSAAFEFDGIDDRLTFPHAAITPTGISSFSVSLWVYHTDLTIGNLYGYINKAMGGRPFLVRYSGTDGLVQFYTLSSSQKGGSFLDTSLDIDTWHHIVATYDGTSMKLYVDNVKSSTEYNQSGTLTPGSSVEYNVGVDWSMSSNYMKGRIDDLRIYDRALSATEIDELYNLNCDTYLPNDNLWALNGSTAYRNGSVSIGTDETPQGYSFSVDGKAIMEEVKVQLSESWVWPDFVFDSNYNLQTLNDIEAYISQNNHLPEIPSAEEVIENGIHLGEMNASLLKKIEELTLHLIQMNKEVKLHNSRINKLYKENSKLQEKIQTLESSR